MQLHDVSSLARALLKRIRSKILVLDEATANVDIKQATMVFVCVHASIKQHQKKHTS